MTCPAAARTIKKLDLQSEVKNFGVKKMVYGYKHKNV